MAITQYTEPATTNPTLTDWQSSIARDNASSRGFAEVDLSSYADGATAPTVAVGSRFDNNGALYVVSGTAESISGIASIAVSTTFYVYYDVSAGVFLASTAAPTFSKTLRGWYNGNDRALFRIYKDSGGEYDDRGVMLNQAYIGSEVSFNNTVNLNGGFTPPTFGDVGSFVVAASTSWYQNGEFLPGTTVAGSTLRYAGETAAGGTYAMNADDSGGNIPGGGVTISTVQNPSITGTWMLLSRVFSGASAATYYPNGLLIRVS